MKGFRVDVRQLEKLVGMYGEKYRILIADSLNWIEKVEKASCFESPMDHEAFIADVIARETNV